MSVIFFIFVVASSIADMRGANWTLKRNGHKKVGVSLEEYIQSIFLNPTQPSDLSTPLYLHRRMDRLNNRLIIFVHGLNGSRYSTWGCYPRYVFEDRTDMDVGLYGYLNGWKRVRNIFSSIPIEKEAEVFSNLIRDLPYEEIIIVGHSLGGLLLKCAISDLIEKKEDIALRKVRALFLMATPQLGAVSRIPILSWIFRDAQALDRYGPTIERTQTRFQDHVNIDIDRRDDGSVHIPTHAIIAAEDIWVSPLSAGAAVKSNMKKVVRASHTSIVKPKTKHDDCYNWFLGRLASSVQSAPTSQQTALPDRSEVEKSLFTIYDPECEPYYIPRSSDQRVLAALDDGLIWAVGSSGAGKTTTLARCANLFGLQPIYVDFSAIQFEPAESLQDRVSKKILVNLLHDMCVDISQYGDNDSEDELLRQVVACSDNKPRLLYLDEIPLADDFVGPFASKLYSITTSLRIKGRGDIKVAVSTIDRPRIQDRALERRLNERFRFIVVDDWTESEILQLIKTISEQFKDLPPNPSLTQLVQAANGNPRVVKTFFRDCYFEPDKSCLDYGRLIEAAIDGALA